MASLLSSPLLLGISVSILISLFFLSPVSAVTCATQKLPSNHNYTNCTNLPTLNTTFHHTYDAANHSLSVAFAADSPSSDGWVGWGINPTVPKMNGTGALITIKENGKVSVKTYNLGQGTYKQEKLSFDVWDLTTEDVGGVITIFAKLKLPEKAANLSQVWQVGPVKSGAIAMHGTAPENIGSVASLSVVGTAVSPNGTAVTPNGTALAPSGSSESGGGAPANSGGVKMMGEKFGMGFYFGLVLVLVSLMNM